MARPTLILNPALATQAAQRLLMPSYGSTTTLHGVDVHGSAAFQRWPLSARPTLGAIVDIDGHADRLTVRLRLPPAALLGAAVLHPMVLSVIMAVSVAKPTLP